MKKDKITKEKLEKWFNTNDYYHLEKRHYDLGTYYRVWKIKKENENLFELDFISPPTIGGNSPSHNRVFSLYEINNSWRIEDGRLLSKLGRSYDISSFSKLIKLVTEEGNLPHYFEYPSMGSLRFHYDKDDNQTVTEIINGKEVELTKERVLEVMSEYEIDVEKQKEIDELQTLIFKNNNMISNLTLDINSWMDEIRELQEVN